MPATSGAAVAALAGVALAGTLSLTFGVALASDEVCPGVYDPTPVAVPVTSVPVVVSSTADDYFVLYVTLDDGRPELPVAVVRGKAHTTELAENIEALGAGSYRVEKYSVSDPADIDGDCVDDLTELDSPATMTPLRATVPVDLNDGAVAIPDMATLELLARHSHGVWYIDTLVTGWDGDSPTVYFVNSNTHNGHLAAANALGIAYWETLYGVLAYRPGLEHPNAPQGGFSFENRGHLLNSADSISHLKATAAARAAGPGGAPPRRHGRRLRPEHRLRRGTTRRSPLPATPTQ